MLSILDGIGISPLYIITILFCSPSNIGDCVERVWPTSKDVVLPIRCMARARKLAFKWLDENPGYIIVRIECSMKVVPYRDV